MHYRSIYKKTFIPDRPTLSFHYRYETGEISCSLNKLAGKIEHFVYARNFDD